MAIVVTSSSELSSSRIHSNDTVPIKLSVQMASNNISDNTEMMTMTSHDHVNGLALSPPLLRHLHECSSADSSLTPQISIDRRKCVNVNALGANSASSQYQRYTDPGVVLGSTCYNEDREERTWPPIESPPPASRSRDDPSLTRYRTDVVDSRFAVSDPSDRSNSRDEVPLRASVATMTSSSSQQTARESAAGTPSTNSPLDLADCISVQRRLRERSTVWGCWPRSTPYPRLVHPLDKGLFLSFTVSIIYLAAAVVAVWPSICIVVVVLPIAILARRGIIRCANAIAVSEAQHQGAGRTASAARSPPTDSAPTDTVNENKATDDEVFEDDDIDTEVRKPLTGHEEFWLGQRSAVTQCLVSFDGHLDIDQLRQLVQVRLLNNGTTSFASSADDRNDHNKQHNAHVSHDKANTMSSTTNNSGNRPGHAARGAPKRRSTSTCSRFMQKLVHDPGAGHSWLFDRQFDIANHVITAPPGVASSPNNLRGYVSQMADRKLSWNRPLWELHLIGPTTSPSTTTSPSSRSRSAADDVTTLALLRLHPVVSDGVKLVRLICCQLADDDDFSASASGWRTTTRCHYGRLAYTFNVVRALFVGLLLLLKKVVSFHDRNLLHRHRTGVTTVSWSRPINMTVVLRVKDVTRSTLNDLLLAALAGSLRHYLLAVGVANPSDLTATLLVDLQPPDTSMFCSTSTAAAQSFSAGSGCPSASHKAAPTTYGRSQFIIDDRGPGFNGGAERRGSGRWTGSGGNNHPSASSAATSTNGGLDGPYTGSSGGSTRADNMTITIDDYERTQATSGVFEGGVEEEDEDSEAGEQTIDHHQHGSVYVLPSHNISTNGILPPTMTSSGCSRVNGTADVEVCRPVPPRKRHHATHCGVNTDVRLSLVDVILPLHTEGAIPRLWDMKQRMNEVKSSSDHVILYVFQTILRYLMPECLRCRLWRLFYSRSSVLVSNLPGPDCSINIAGRQVKDAMFWFPPLDGAAVSVSFLTYAGQLYMTVAADTGALPDPDYITTSFVAEMEKLVTLLAHRRIPGEHSLRRRSERSGLSVAARDPDINEIQVRISEVQKQLRELETSLEMDPDQELSDDESRLVEQLEGLKVEFGEMLFELRHKLNVHVSPESQNDDDYDSDDGVLRPQYRRLSLHSAAVSSRGLLSAMSVGAARMLHVPTGSPPPGAPIPWSVGYGSESDVVEDGDAENSGGIPRRYHSFHRAVTRPPSRVGRARLSLDCGMTGVGRQY